MPPDLTGPRRVEQEEPDMTPNSPSELADLIYRATEERARDIFEDFDDFTPSMQRQARLLMRCGMNDQLSDIAFRELMGITLAFWRDCNQARFHANNSSRGDMHTLMRSAQIDQFINTMIVALEGLPQLSNEVFSVDEPNGS